MLDSAGRALAILCLVTALSTGGAEAQDVTPPGSTLPTLGAVTASTPAKQLFGRKPTPAQLAPRSIGFYAKGCLAGGAGPARRRPDMGGHAPVAQPQLGQCGDDRLPGALLRAGAARLVLARHSRRRHLAAARRPDADGPCLASDRSRRRHLADAEAGAARCRRRRARDDVGDQCGPRRPPRRQPRLDRRFAWPSSAWPRRTRRSSASSSTPRSRRRSAAMPAATVPGSPRSARCMATTIISTSASPARRARSGCTPQAPPPGDDGCGKELDYWFSDAVLHPKPPKTPPRPKPPLTMADLPAACRQVLAAP